MVDGSVYVTGTITWGGVLLFPRDICPEGEAYTHTLTHSHKHSVVVASTKYYYYLRSFNYV